MTPIQDASRLLHEKLKPMAFIDVHESAWRSFALGVDLRIVGVGKVKVQVAFDALKNGQKFHYPALNCGKRAKAKLDQVVRSKLGDAGRYGDALAVLTEPNQVYWKVADADYAARGWTSTALADRVTSFVSFVVNSFDVER
jgi:hypothetical protein